MMVRAKINAIAGASNTVDRPSLVHDLELQRSPAVILCPPRNNSDCPPEAGKHDAQWSEGVGTSTTYRAAAMCPKLYDEGGDPCPTVTPTQSYSVLGSAQE